MRRNKNKEIKLIFALLTVIFLVFLAIPVARLLMKSFVLDGTGEFTIDNYRSVLISRGFLRAVSNSFLVSCCSASYDYLWICHYLFLWKAGTSDQAVRKTAL